MVNQPKSTDDLKQLISRVCNTIVPPNPPPEEVEKVVAQGISITAEHLTKINQFCKDRTLNALKKFATVFPIACDDLVAPPKCGISNLRACFRDVHNWVMGRSSVPDRIHTAFSECSPKDLDVPPFGRMYASMACHQSSTGIMGAEKFLTERVGGWTFPVKSAFAQCPAFVTLLSDTLTNEALTLIKDLPPGEMKVFVDQLPPDAAADVKKKLNL